MKLIYTLTFFAHLLSPRTIQEATARYSILPTDQLDHRLAATITKSVSPSPTEHPQEPAQAPI